jgi:3-oxoacyl-[acyl-carrier-protein] synthase II
MSLDEIDNIQAHAAGTVADDKTEAAVLESVFGDRIDTIPVVSVKSMIGHTQGACGVIETAAAVLSMYKGVLLRSVNCDTVDPNCRLRINRCRPVNTYIGGMLLNTFGFGGKNASIVLRAVG